MTAPTAPVNVPRNVAVTTIVTSSKFATSPHIPAGSASLTNAALNPAGRMNSVLIILNAALETVLKSATVRTIAVRTSNATAKLVYANVLMTAAAMMTVANLRSAIPRLINAKTVHLMNVAKNHVLEEPFVRTTPHAESAIVSSVIVKMIAVIAQHVIATRECAPECDLGSMI